MATGVYEITKKEDENELIKSFGLSVFNTSTEVISLAADTLISELASNEVVKGIPFVGAVFSLCKFGIAIGNYFSLKKTINFIEQLNKNTLSENSRNKYICKIYKNDKKLFKELEKVILILENASSIEKCKILGNIYYCFIRGMINWETFCELAEANNRLFDADCRILLNNQHVLLSNNKTKINDGEPYSNNLDRMVSIGLFAKNQLTGILFTDEVHLDHYRYFLTEFGHLFIQCAKISSVSNKEMDS